jgi:hypothetical protein
MGPDVDYATTPSEDFASVTIEFETADGHRVHRRGDDVVELRRRRAAAVRRAAGPRVLAVLELARPGLNLFFSRR